MIELTREVRFALNADNSAATDVDGRKNAWSAWPRMVGVAPYLKLQTTVVGKVDPQTGYLCNIKTIDDLVLRHVVPRLAEIPAGAVDSAEQMVRLAWRVLNENAPPGVFVSTVCLLASPFLKYSIAKNEENMVTLTQQFEFSAAHRLHCVGMSDDANQNMFGKCNNPHGHGHNYVVDVSVAANGKSRNYLLGELERNVMETVVDRFDHKHLNVEVAEFENVNPTVENIAKVVWDLLVDSLAGMQLKNVRVYETPKTWADYAGG